MDVGVPNDINLSIGGVDGCHAITGSFPNKDTLPTIVPYARSLSVTMCMVIQLFLTHSLQIFLYIQLSYS